MSFAAYTMITVGSVPIAAQKPFLEGLGTLAEELRTEAGSVSTRYGIVATGEHSGRVILYQSYAELSGIEAAFAHYTRSQTYADLVATEGFEVKLRNIVRNEHVGLSDPSGDAPAYAVIARWRSDGPMLDELRAEIPHFEKAGAMILRYGTLMTGSDAGKRLLTVGYPSMDSIEKAYDGLRGSAGYHDFLLRVTFDWRNIVRVVG
jgi:hypothetical protein